MKYKNIAPARPYVQKRLKEKSIRVLFDEEKMKTELARLIRNAREEAGLSQRALAKEAGTTQAVVARLESGYDRRVPSLLLVARLLKAAGQILEIRTVQKMAA